MACGETVGGGVSRVKLALVLLLVGPFAFASNVTAATITGVVAGGTAVPGPNVTTSGATATTLSHAEVGAWTGDGHAPEPLGTDSLTISIDVGAGGRLDFDWSVRSVDGCYYDPIRIYLQTPGGTKDVFVCAGSPPPNETHANGATGHGSLDLAGWANQSVALVVEQSQEGDADQTQTVIDNLVLAQPVPIRLGTLSTSPPRPVAGRVFAISIPVLRSDGQAQTGVTVSCAFRVGGIRLSSVGRFTNATARCMMKIPARARGGGLTGSLIVKIEQRKPLARNAAYRIT
jgi:hypothetical protein